MPLGASLPRKKKNVEEKPVSGDDDTVPPAKLAFGSSNSHGSVHRESVDDDSSDGGFPVPVVKKTEEEK